jgi:hypothetical protein
MSLHTTNIGRHVSVCVSVYVSIVINGAVTDITKSTKIDQGNNPVQMRALWIKERLRLDQGHGLRAWQKYWNTGFTSPSNS